MKESLGIIIAVLCGIGIAAILTIDHMAKIPDKGIAKVIDVIYNPKDSSWHLDIVTGKDTVEVPVNAQVAAKFIRK